jgi:hypothetical protein
MREFQFFESIIEKIYFVLLYIHFIHCYNSQKAVVDFQDTLKLIPLSIGL